MSEQSSGRTSVEQIIKAAVARGASDLHIKAGDVFRARINGELVPLTKQRLTDAKPQTDQETDRHVELRP